MELIDLKKIYIWQISKIHKTEFTSKKPLRFPYNCAKHFALMTNL